MTSRPHEKLTSMGGGIKILESYCLPPKTKTYIGMISFNLTYWAAQSDKRLQKYSTFLNLLKISKGGTLGKKNQLEKLEAAKSA